MSVAADATDEVCDGEGMSCSALQWDMRYIGRSVLWELVSLHKVALDVDTASFMVE